jgi:hypothetical protein
MQFSPLESSSILGQSICPLAVIYPAAKGRHIFLCRSVLRAGAGLTLLVSQFSGALEQHRRNTASNAFSAPFQLENEAMRKFLQYLTNNKARSRHEELFDEIFWIIETLALILGIWILLRKQNPKWIPFLVIEYCWAMDNLRHNRP